MPFDQVEMSDEQDEQTNPKELISLFNTFVGFHVIKPLVIAKKGGDTECFVFIL